MFSIISIKAGGYGRKDSLSFETLERIVREAEELGIKYIFTAKMAPIASAWAPEAERLFHSLSLPGRVNVGAFFLLQKIRLFFSRCSGRPG